MIIKAVETVIFAKIAKNGNDLYDLDLNNVTLRSIKDVDLVHTYI